MNTLQAASASPAQSSSVHCVTCSDEGVPMLVLEVPYPGIARCDDDVEVMTDLVGPVEPGDELLVHAGVALLRLG